MTKEEYLKKLILQRWTLKDFAAKINMPYGTLYSILYSNQTFVTHS